MSIFLGLFALGWIVFFGWELIATLRQLDEVEQERDALWDELHGIERPAPRREAPTP